MTNFIASLITSKSLINLMNKIKIDGRNGEKNKAKSLFTFSISKSLPNRVILSLALKKSLISYKTHLFRH